MRFRTSVCLLNQRVRPQSRLATLSTVLFGTLMVLVGTSSMAYAQTERAASVSSTRSVDWVSHVAASPTVSIGIVKYVKPAPMEPIVEASLRALKCAFEPQHVQVHEYSVVDLEKAVKAGDVDFFIGSAGLLQRLTPYGARALVTAASPRFPDPNHNDGTAILVTTNSPFKRLDDLKGRHLITSTPRAFTGLQIPLGVIKEAGYDPDNFFGSIEYLGDGANIQQSFQRLIDHQADVAFMRLCLLESWEELHPAWKGHFRVINDLTQAHEVCKRSTPLYPTWTLASTRSSQPNVSRDVTKTLLAMAPTREGGFYWSVATDLSEVDTLFKKLKIGPYAYLREWTLKRVWDTYQLWIVLAIVILIGLTLHGIRVEFLVRRRTARLHELMDRQAAMQEAQHLASKRIAHLEKVSALGQLSTIFAHEMRQPLRAISLYNYAISRALSKTPVDVGALQKLCEKIEGQTQRANTIVNRVRAWAKSEGPMRHPTHLQTLLDRTLAEVESMMPEHCPLVVSGDWDLTLLVDPLGLELVLLNLIKNVLEAGQNSTLPNPQVKLVSVVNEDTLDISVINETGPVSDRDWEAIHGFNESGKRDGLGLGLAIVRHLLVRENVHLESERTPAGVCMRMRFVRSPNSTSTRFSEHEEH